MSHTVVSLPPTQVGRESMDVGRMKECILSFGVVVCNSPKNRRKLYTWLEQQHLRWISTGIGYTSGNGKSLNPYRARGPGRRKCSLLQYARWIHQKRLLLEDVVITAGYDGSVDDHYHDASGPNLASAWDDGLSVTDILGVLSQFKDRFETEKYHPLNTSVLRKQTVEILLVRTLELLLTQYLFDTPLAQLVFGFLILHHHPSSLLSFVPMRRKDVE